MVATGWVRIWRSLRECRLARRGPSWELLMIHLVMDAEWQGPARGTLTVSVRDYGRGIPLGKLVDVSARMNTGGKYDSKAFKKSVGLNGVGIKAVNALDTVEYYSFDEVSPRLYGKHIRIIGGRLNGFEGRLMSKRGSKTKRLIIDLEDCNLSAAIQVESDYIQLIK